MYVYLLWYADIDNQRPLLDSVHISQESALKREKKVNHRSYIEMKRVEDNEQ